MEIHKTAIVHQGAVKGKGVEIGPYAVIGENVKIGDNAKIGAYVLIEGWTSIGRNCQISPGAIIGTAAQDLKFRSAKSYVEIGDNVIIREYLTINSPTTPEGTTRIGNNCFLMAYSHIAHDCQLADNVVLANASALAGHVNIDCRAILGGLVGVHQFVQIGSLCIIGGCSRVTMDVLPFVRAVGTPLKICGLNTVGLERANVPLETRKILKDAYRIIFRSGLNTSQACEKIKRELPAITEIKYLLEFISRSKRGIAK